MLFGSRRHFSSLFDIILALWYFLALIDCSWTLNPPSSFWWLTKGGYNLLHASSSNLENSSATFALHQKNSAEQHRKFSEPINDEVSIDIIKSTVTVSTTTATAGTPLHVIEDMPMSPKRRKVNGTSSTEKQHIDRTSLLCPLFDDHQLYKRLTDSGHYNPALSANTIEEIVLRMIDDFRDQLIDQLAENVSNIGETTTTSSDEIVKSTSGVENSTTVGVDGSVKQSPEEVSHQSDVFFMPQLLDDDHSAVSQEKDQLCNEECRILSKIFKTILFEDENSSNTVIQNQHSHELLTSMEQSILIKSPLNADLKVTQPSCKPERVIKIGQCRSSSSSSQQEFHQDYMKLCPTCRLLYKLPQYCFPRYVNALHCYNSDERQYGNTVNDNDNSNTAEFHNSESQNLTCIHESWSGHAHGKCVGKKTNLVVMKNVGDEKCPNWIFETIPVPMYCECLLNSRSWLRA